MVLATFNGAQYLGEQLDSLARQERLPDELVGSVFYEPVERGLELQLREKLLALRAARDKARGG